LVKKLIDGLILLVENDAPNNDIEDNKEESSKHEVGDSKELRPWIIGLDARSDIMYRLTS
jgi:hypothetical protein